MRIPAGIAQHPVESVIAGLLLLALLFVSADFGSPNTQMAAPQIQASAQPQKM